MKKIALSLTFLALAFPVLHAAPAQAQNHYSWVASSANSGSDANTCVRASPCATFAHALTQTFFGGVIRCVDQGEYGLGLQLVISGPLTIDCEGVQASYTGPTDQVAILVNSVSSTVVLRGLEINVAISATAGIDFVRGSALHIEKCVINNVNSSGSGYGIALEAETDSSTMVLYVSDTAIMNSNQPGTGTGILVKPIANNTVNKVILNRVEARNNFFGIKADGTRSGTSGGVINMTVRDSVASGNDANGIVGTSNASGPAVVMLVDQSTASHNGVGYGVIADGPKTFIEMTRSAVSGNNFGIGASNGGNLISYQDNRVTLNSTDGSPTGVISLK